MNKIVNINNINPITFELQTYKIDDEKIIANSEIEVNFNPNEDYLEYFVLNLSGDILFENVEGYPKYQIQNNNIVIDPQRDLESEGFEEGQYNTIYNFLKRKLFSSALSTLYIQEISSDRTELRLNTNKINNNQLIDSTNEFINSINNAVGFYEDFYINFGKNKLVIANNILLDDSNIDDPTILIKLYEPLPNEFNIKSECWVVEKISISKAYNVELIQKFENPTFSNFIQGPNFNLDIKDQINNSTTYQNKNTLTQNSSILGSGSLTYQINSILAEKGIEINIDYSDYENFIHFSSAQTRLENFYYKLSLIEQYTESGSYSNNLNSYYVTGSQNIWRDKIDNIITNFDSYEYFLYFESGSKSWPKINNIPPYINYNTTSSIGLDWLTNQSYSASFYDSENKDLLNNSIPSYLREDESNAGYELFVNMLGQHFDNVWVYIKDITEKFNADNRVNYGISKDLVATAIRDLGVKIYQNNFSDTDLYSALLGLTPSGSTFTLPYSSTTLPITSGFEYITSFITASNSSSVEPIDDVNKELYKRIYHNIPILLKKKGTIEGLRILINIYGIPDTILRINEYGGKSTTIQNNFDNFVDKFNYYVQFQPGAFFTSTFSENEAGLPYKTVAFRFKPSSIPTQSFSQSLAVLYGSSIPGYPNTNLHVVFEYIPILSGSYSGSIESQYNTYGTLKLYDNNANKSCSVYLPIFDGNWWSVMVTQDFTYPDSLNTSSLYVSNKIYEGYDGSQIGFIASASILGGTGWGGGDSFFNLSNDTNISFAGKTYTPFDGGFQELRYYTEKLNEEVFKEFTMNPYSIRGNSQTSSYDSITFRAPLGTTLDYNSGSGYYTSIHPSITGSNPSTQSFNNDSEYRLIGNYEFIPQNEIIYQNQFHAGIRNSVTEKIKIIDEIIPEGNTLSKYISIQQYSPLSESFSKNINVLDVSFSPQDEVNDDIISQLGSFNIGDYIGDPRHISSSLTYYPHFNKLRDNYFEKYIHNYNLWDYIRLIKFYDNSLFKMIKDFTPARTNLSTGVVIKQTLLERNRYPVPQSTSDNNVTFVGSPTTKQNNIPY